MCAELVERRLAAILAADVVGYSRLLEANEEETLNALRQHRRELFDPAVASHGGHIIKVMGDGFLVEFGSVLSAARCAVEIQRGMLERNMGTPADKHFSFRIGLNLGDIIFDADDFHGDGINVAVRLQALADPGGIACSAAVRHEVGNKLDLNFADQGAKTVKNISRPVHVYFADWGNVASGEEVPLTASGHTQAPINKPSVAILPFTNISNDPAQEFFSDGITEDIITDLSNVSGLFVLSRNTVFTWKGRSENLQRIARELGVAYIVEGSVRKAGNHVRINAELIDAASDGHMWAARYDRDLTDIFEVQDEITKAIVEQLKVKLLPEEKKAIEQAPTDSVEAYTHYLRGREYYHIASRSNHLMARQSFARAIELDPGYARAYAGIAVCDSRLRSQFGTEIPVEDILANTAMALSIDPNLAEAHAAKGFALAVAGNRAEAVSAFEEALSLDADCHEANRYYAEFCVTEGQFELAATYFQRAMEIKPADYGAPTMLVHVFRSLGQADKANSYAWIALKKAEEELRLHPENANVACLGATVLAFLGVRDRALEWLARSLATDPNDINIQYNAACTYALLGETDRAIEVLEAWMPQVGAEMRLWFKNDSDLDSIRSHPRYSRLVELSE
ncbi:adenylate/guanylate cyclase domain-containing protein [Rhizobium leguminosarum]|uniref:adenylate/guanylate cyclase domain-containing protein n=1 Tax=Rhizobium leguminosarum TaxID=384 RepID=UPI001A91DEC2|nr:adenylate/guanylate cyclase domain-containing protein [Rhizobium leguminosarum]MBY5556238.1 adenylate/guanylate cyclase domain-containing protein [Rhizobium leguminosarum]MBY5638012.1 adenylate/guanylate cyclase domain-containing protein [Rhizobium leguminosarum]MBY5692311.1 adenylate/guanylate cyclase domain-containing protein [Rhizobium leguminosarum]MBY5725999.1 adenylate/guanylate cyclase domain-containing protein [Rhizobium leguminosarum]MBY5746305.1 adenylate/guanylate cyclase domain-